MGEPDVAAGGGGGEGSAGAGAAGGLGVSMAGGQTRGRDVPRRSRRAEGTDAHVNSILPNMEGRL